MARPEKPIDWNLVEELIDAQCVGTEIAAYFNVCSETFYDRFVKEFGTNFTNYSRHRSQCGKAAIKLAQYQKATNDNHPGNTQLLLWLGKVVCGQKEPDTNSSYPAEMVDQIRQLMNQISSEQSARKTEDNSNNADNKS